MTYYDNPNTKFVAVQVREMDEEGRYVYGVILTMLVEDGDIEYGQIDTFQGGIKYTAQPTNQFYQRMEREVERLENLGHHHYECLTQDEVDKHIAQYEMRIQFMNDEIARLRLRNFTNDEIARLRN
jgi:hypothetical protein